MSPILAGQISKDFLHLLDAYVFIEIIIRNIRNILQVYEISIKL